MGTEMEPLCIMSASLPAENGSRCCLIATIRFGPLLIRGVRLVECQDRRGWALEWPMIKNEGLGYYEDIIALWDWKDHHQVMAALVKAYQEISRGRVNVQ